jgi:predicted Zn-dependent peptidase
MDGLRASWAGRAVPTGSILVMAGAVEPGAAMDVVRRSLGSWAGATKEPPVVAAPIGGVDHLIQDSSQTHLAIALHAPVDADPDSNALRLASMVLGGESSSRLFTEVREKRGLCYSVGASVSLGRDRGMMQVYAGSTPERAGQTLSCIRTELERFGGGITADEFERARTGLKARVVMQGESAAARASSVAGDLFRMGRARTLGDMAAAFDALTLDGVNAAIARHWGPGWTDRMVLASIGPAPLEVGR